MIRSDQTPLLCQIEDHLATITLNRPDVHNVVNEALMDAWESALDQIENTESLRAIIITGAGDRTFCAGGDLKYFSGITEPEQTRAMSERMQAILSRLYEGRLPVIAAINGSAYGGGCEILTACHFRIAPDDVFFQFRQTAMGVVTGWGGGLRLFRQVNRSHALKLLLTGDRFSAEEARSMGFIDKVAPRSMFEQEAKALANRIAERSPQAVTAFLELARLADSSNDETVKKRETDLFVDCWQGSWFRDAMDAFLNRK